MKVVKLKIDNPYLRMDIERVRADAVRGVFLARLTLADWDPAAARRLNIGIEPGHHKQHSQNEVEG